jgi:hypothetical protein
MRQQSLQVRDCTDSPGIRGTSEQLTNDRSPGSARYLPRRYHIRKPRIAMPLCVKGFVAFSVQWVPGLPAPGCGCRSQGGSESGSGLAEEPVPEV